MKARTSAWFHRGPLIPLDPKSMNGSDISTFRWKMQPKKSSHCVMGRGPMGELQAMISKNRVLFKKQGILVSLKYIYDCRQQQQINPECSNLIFQWMLQYETGADWQKSCRRVEQKARQIFWCVELFINAPRAKFREEIVFGISWRVSPVSAPNCLFLCM